MHTGWNLDTEDLICSAKNIISANLKITKNTAFVSVSALTTIYVVWKTWKGIQIRRKLPRFPGHYYFYLGNYKYAIRGEDRAEFALLQQQRDNDSDAITISVPDLNNYNIVVTDVKLAKECFVRNGAHTSARVFSLLENYGYFLEKYFKPRYSITGSTGNIWHDNRRKALGGFRELGVGKNRLEQLINIETDYLIESLLSNLGSTQKETLSHLFATATTNVICQLSFGIRFNYDDPEFRSLYKSLRMFFDGKFLTSPRVLLPQTIRRAPLLYNKDVEEFFSAVENMTEFIEKQVVLQQNRFKANPNEFDINQEECLLKTFIKQFSNKPISKQEDIMTSVLFDMFVAGTDTTSTTLDWAIYFLRNHQDIQKSLQNEIAENISSEQIFFSDMEKLPMCHAFLLETMRFGSIAPATAPHVITKEFSAGKYTFPKGSTIEISIFCMSRDRRIFKNHDQFDITNFLKNGKVEIPEDFIPFGIGPRFCVGEKIARTEAFVFLTNIMKKLSFSPSSMNDSLDDNNSLIGMVRSPGQFLVNIKENC